MNEMNMVEILSEELGEKELRIMALEKKLKKFMKKGLVDTLNKDMCETHFMFNGIGYPIWDNMDENSDDSSCGDKNIWEEIVKEMNDDDWNNDEKYCELFINQFNVINIRYRECCECNRNSVKRVETDDLILHPDIDKEHGYFCKRCHHILFDEPSDDEYEFNKLLDR